jgi:osmotically-inducible protein OsmY
MNAPTIGKILTIAVAFGVISLHAATVTVTGAENRAQLTPLERQVRKELITLPFYTVFDYFEFQVEGDKVILHGDVDRPSLKVSAERVVQHVPGVREVDNQVEVLPLSSFDNGIRRGLVRAIYHDEVLNRYAAGPNPWIRLIVRNGNITLEGYVDRATDKDIASIRANGVPFAFSVTNNLKVKAS